VQTEECATGFDAPNATYPHKDREGLCSFASLVHERLAHDQVLVEMARIVQAADFSDQVGDHLAARVLHSCTMRSTQASRAPQRYDFLGQVFHSHARRASHLRRGDLSNE
jgi:hypothetical protein